MGAPIGNDNSASGKDWTLAIKRALARRGNGDFRAGLDVLADKLVKAAESNEAAFMKAIEAVGDRIEGKPVAAIEAKADVRMEISWDDGREDTNTVSPEAPSA